MIKNELIRRFIKAGQLVLLASNLNFPAYADTENAGSLHQIDSDKTDNGAFMRDYGLSIGGWATAGVNYNTHNPRNDSNGPISMTDHANQLNLYQLDLYFEKALVKNAGWEVGGRFDFMFGTDTYYTQATGNWDMGIINNKNQYNLAFPQAYVEVFAPIGNGLTAKFGHFYTIIGYESVPSGPNFFSSHTYSFKSSPFTTTGALFTYALTDRWSINLGAVTGADNFDRSLGAWSQMSGVTWNNNETGTTLSFSIMHGDVYDSHTSKLVYYSAILQQSFGNWRYVLQHDRGTQDYAANQQAATWYSIVNYLTYQISDTFGAGVRGEWFRDQNGFRYSYGEAGYYAATFGLNWKPKDWIMVRPEVRYDWSESQIAPFDQGRHFNQVVLGVDAVISF